MCLSEGPALGLHVNLGKCELYWPSPPAEGWPTFPADVRRVPREGVSLLGSAIGSPAQRCSGVAQAPRRFGERAGSGK